MRLKGFIFDLSVIISKRAVYVQDVPLTPTCTNSILQQVLFLQLFPERGKTWTVNLIGKTLKKKVKENLFAGCAGHIYSSHYLLTVDGEHQQA